MLVYFGAERVEPVPIFDVTRGYDIEMSIHENIRTASLTSDNPHHIPNSVDESFTNPDFLQRTQ